MSAYTIPFDPLSPFGRRPSGARLYHSGSRFGEPERRKLCMGGPDEATYYVTECGQAWHRTPGAVVWLTKLAATLTPKRRTRATMH